MTNNFSIDKHIGNEIYLIWYADILRPLESIEITKVVNIKLFSPCSKLLKPQLKKKKRCCMKTSVC